MVKSPCINVCKMDEGSGLCLGCFRTLDEIAGWSASSDQARLDILDKVARRRREHDLSQDGRHRDCSGGGKG